MNATIARQFALVIGPVVIGLVGGSASASGEAPAPTGKQPSIPTTLPTSLPANSPSTAVDLAGIPPLTSDPYDGTRRMAAILERIAATADPMKNPNLNRQRAEFFRKQLADAKDSRAATSARFSLARELLHQGDSEGAAREFEFIQQQIDRSGGPASFPKLAPSLRYELGMTYLRLGEQENCIARHGPESCLLPIRGTGIHTVQRGSRKAIEQFTASLKANPEDYASRWLLNVAYMTLGEHPDKVPPAWLIPPSVFESDYDIKRFPNVAPQLGLNNTNLAGGAIMEDFDRDGDLDIMTSAWGLRDPLRYYVNNGDGTFSERSSEARLTGIVGGLNLSHADYDNDGYPDVLVIRGAWLGEEGLHPESLLRNMGDGTFADVTEAAGLLSFHPSHSAGWADFDQDGWLDLFIGHETRPEGSMGGMVVQSDAITSGTSRHPHPCQLFRNNRDGTFTDVAAEVGVANVGFVKGITWGDYNNDGLPDLYLSQLGNPNRLFRNDGPRLAGETGSSSRPASPSWSFTDVSAAAGVTEPRNSFPTWFFDYDNDGWLDLFAMGYAWSSVGDQARDYMGMPHPAELPRLYRNQRDGTFADVTREAKLNKLLITMGCNFGDLDNDGYPDFYAGTGDPDFRSIVPNRMFRNAAGKFFQDVTTSGGFGHLQKGHGVVFGDLDQDGDQDVFEEMGGALEGDQFQNVLYLNPGHGNHWINLWLEGVKTNRNAIGARIKVRVAEGDTERDIHSVVNEGGSFGCNPYQRAIGLGKADAIRFIEVFWPVSRETQRFENIEMDGYYSIREGDAAPVKLERKPIKLKGMDG